MAKSKLSLGCLFWLALILLVIVIILANLKTANEIIHKTGFDKFVESVFKKKTDDVQPAPTEEETKNTVTPIPVNEDQKDKPTPTKASEYLEPTPKPKTKTSDTSPTQKPSASEKTSSATKDPAAGKPNVRNAKIYFVKPNSDGTTSVKGFTRQVHYKDEPLFETIQTLIAGPVDAETRDDYVSMIPEKTKINQIYIKNEVAYMDLSEDFRFNSSGKEGQKAQVSQIVYTATEFSNVKSVSFLIDGEKVDYLGPEGVYIGKPITREGCAGL
jgi:germination protein M